MIGAKSNKVPRNLYIILNQTEGNWVKLKLSFTFFFCVEYTLK